MDRTLLPESLTSLPTERPIWARFFTVAPLVVVGTREPEGGYDLAPKHLAMPLGWRNRFAFVCSPRHRTYHNARREEAFTVTFPRPSQIVVTSLAASPRCEDETKPVVAALPTFPARLVDAPFVEEGNLFLGCRLERVIDGFDENSLVVGTIVEAYARDEALRTSEREDQDVIRRAPLLVYLSPGYFARVEEARAFPFPEGFSH